MGTELKWSANVGTIHRARWMAAAIYILKMVIVGEDRFKMGPQQGKGLLDLAFFIVYIFAWFWFSVPVTADVPFLTLSLWKELNAWASRDPTLAFTLIRKLDLHTWYISPRHVTLALFSRRVDDETKGKIVAALKQSPRCEIPMGKPSRPQINDSSLEDFVSSESWTLFEVNFVIYYPKLE